MNPIYSQLERFADEVRLVAKGLTTFCAADGPPGIGKTHTVRQVAQAEHKRFKAAAGSPAGFTAALWEHKNIPILAMDDFDAMLRSERLANILKGALEPIRDRAGKLLPRKVVDMTKEALKNATLLAKGKGNPLLPPPTFFITCGLVMTSNNDLTHISRDMKAHVAAVKDRGIWIHLSRDRKHIAGYINDIIDYDRTPFMADLDPSEFGEVMAYFNEHILDWSECTFRVIQGMVLRYRVLGGDKWKQIS